MLSKMYLQLRNPFLWFNMSTAPYILIWPDLSLESENRYTWMFLWINEFIWGIDIVRKVFD